ncbi:hypothetical protein BJ742DRAFT_813343 [Cladochytrium replicatum]|nr:hypothetical protein BJ742DRAFT_813343 [Cladochytrium replicatum]
MLRFFSEQIFRTAAPHADQCRRIFGKSMSSESLSSGVRRGGTWTFEGGKLTVVETIAAYRALRNKWYREGKSVGFVPTMGALHEGHVSLVKLAKSQCDVTVSTIFVNPAQFAPHEDLSKYPRTLEGDLMQLAEVGCNIVVVPSVEEMYPAGITLNVAEQTGSFVDVLGLSHQMEGSIRPHFFRGVATIVTKLFNLIDPTTAYFGQKDAQQCVVIRALARDLLFPVNVRVGATVREVDGLAMSSRNRYLGPVQRSRIAPSLYKALLAGKAVFDKEVASGRPVARESILAAAKSVVDDVKKEVEALRRSPDVSKDDQLEGGLDDLTKVELEYLSIASPHKLVELERLGTEENKTAIFSGALRIGKTRIIDNILLGMEVDEW